LGHTGSPFWKFLFLELGLAAPILAEELVAEEVLSPFSSIRIWRNRSAMLLARAGGAMDFLSQLFSSSDFQPLGYCYLRNSGLVWQNVISDAPIVFAVFTIPFSLLLFIRKRHDLPFSSMFAFFGVFILACGMARDNGTSAFFARDGGAGFDLAYADQLFAGFQQVHAGSEFADTGVGLATVQRIVHSHGGHIWAEIAVDHGATFYFTLGEKTSLGPKMKNGGILPVEENRKEGVDSVLPQTQYQFGSTLD
jgi:hypothetical protein